MHSQDSGPSSCGDEAPGGRAADPHAADLTAVGQEAWQCHAVSNAVLALTEKRPLPSAPSSVPWEQHGQHRDGHRLVSRRFRAQ